MQIPEEQRASGGQRIRTLAFCAIALTGAIACSALAQQSNSKQTPGGTPAATTKPATGSSDNQGIDELKRLIEEKMREQGQDPSNLPEGQSAATQPAKPARQRAIGETPRRAGLAKDAVGANGLVQSRPAQGEAGKDQPAQSQPAKGCSAGAKTQVDLTPPPPDQPQPRWTVEQDTVEVPPVWKGKEAKFVFHAKNTGEGALNIQIKGG